MTRSDAAATGGTDEADGPATIGAAHAAFVASASLVLLLSATPDAAPDVSPRGDLPGFVRVVAGSRLQLPHRIGNNRIDTIRNLLLDPRVALLFLAAGDDRVLTVQGTARILTDPALLAGFAHNGRAPRSVVEIAVEAAELAHCPALAIAEFWHAEPGDARRGIASLGAILADQVGGMSKEQGEAFVANSYANKLY